MTEKRVTTLPPLAGVKIPASLSLDMIPTSVERSACFEHTLRSLLGTALLFLLLSDRMSFGQDAEAGRVSYQAIEAISNIRQITFEGSRSGEGYFSSGGKYFVFQSEREADNPFYQIYLMDQETGDTQRVSPGYGKTTCAWVHPDQNRVMFASTQFDPQAKQKQADEIAFRASGETRRYSWDYDPEYELVEFNLATQQYVRLTNTMGYDAEGSYSPDGNYICFASNRRAYNNELNDEEQKLFEQDPASAMDIYIMQSDGTDVRRLTTAVGYDGGPFFSHDGKRICWRRFDRSGALAEIYTMNIDGTNQKQITHMNAMNWAPFFHPCDQYLIFTSNVEGFANMELFIVDANGEHAPVRVTDLAGFDALSAFDTTGNTLVWTRKPTGGQSQLYEATWNHQLALESLGLTADAPPSSIPTKADESDQAAAKVAAAETVPDITAADIARHVDYLCRPELGGRLTGTEGEQKATSYVAAYLETIGLEPAGDDGSYFQEFEFVSNVELGTNNRLTANGTVYEVNQQWRPVFFSQRGVIEEAEVVYAGYGIVAPAGQKGDESQAEYDSYVHLDVQDKWVLVFRQMPQDISPERRQHLARYSGDRYKAMLARERGARGLIFVSGPNSPIRERVMPLRLDGSLGSTSLAVVSIDDPTAEKWFQLADRNLKDEQTKLDGGEAVMGYALAGVRCQANIDVVPVTSRGRNVVARIPAQARDGAPSNSQSILIGAHIDHLGTGRSASSLARDDEQQGMHRGADDNASGVAVMLEIAQSLVQSVKTNPALATRNIVVAAWSGEELGLRGSQAYAEEFLPYPTTADHAHANSGHGHPSTEHITAPEHPPVSLPQKESASVIAYLNMDMVGRLRDHLVLQGIGSSPYWRGAIERRNAVVKLPLLLQDDCNLPTDATTFYSKRIPILSAFTGSHEEYHTPRDVPELLNYDGTADIAKLLTLMARDLLQNSTPPEFTEHSVAVAPRAQIKVYLGTIPDYSDTEIKGVKLSGVTAGSPSAQASLKSGDIVIALAGRAIENIYDYTYAIEALKAGQTVKIRILRGDEELELDITPSSRE